MEGRNKIKKERRLAYAFDMVCVVFEGVNSYGLRNGSHLPISTFSELFRSSEAVRHGRMV